MIASPAGTVIWRAFTTAEPEIRGDDVILKKDGKRITLHKFSADGVWTIADPKPPTAAENQNSGHHVIVLTAPQAERVVLSVEIQP